VHPVSFDAQYTVERNRLTVFFRLLLAIPWILWGALYAFATLFAVVFAWFALLFTGRYPDGLHGFVAGFTRFSARVNAWVCLVTDEFPPFGGDSQPEYPVRVEVGPPQASYDRVKTFFKVVTAIPQFLIGSGAQNMAAGAAFVSWWRIVFTGKQSATMHDALLAGLAYQTRSGGFLMLLTETHPRLLELAPPAYPADAPALPPPPATAVPPGP
jgi:hypothetical protein